MPVALVTGVTGQTGSYLAEILVDRGWSVHGTVRPGDTLPSAAAFAQVVPHLAELSEAESLRSVVDEVEPDAVINLAALSSVAQSWSQPLATATINGLAVAALLDAANGVRERTGKRVAFVQASSAEIFGAAREVPQRETTPLAPVNPYGASKAYGHLLTGVYRGLGLGASSVILYNHESPRRPETFVTRKITAGVARIALGLQSKLVLGGLTVKRDWGWAPDYARAIADLAGGEHPGDYVVATGESHTIADFVAAAFRAAGADDWEHLVELDAAFARPVEAPELRGDASRIREVYGWRPSIGFDELVQRMVEADLDAERARLT